MIFNKILKIFIFCLGIIISLHALVYFVREGTKIGNYLKSGTINSDVHLNADSLIVMTEVDSVDFLQPVYPTEGDIIVSINDSAGVISRWVDNFASPLEPRRIVPIEFVHNGDTLLTEIKTHLPHTHDVISDLAIEIIRILLTLSFIAVGLWAFFKRPDSGGVRALTLFCFAMASFLVHGVQVYSSRYASFDIPFANILSRSIGNLTPFFGGFWLNLQLLFPRPKRFILEKPVAAYLLCYAPVAITLSAVIIDPNILSQLFVIIVFSAISLQIFAGFAILWKSYNRADNSLERRQTRLVLYGSGIGLSTLFVLLAIAAIFPAWINQWKMGNLIVTLCFFALLLSPLSFAYAFQKYRLLEVEGKLRRGTRYILVTAALLAVFIAAIYLVGELLLTNLGITSRTPTLIVALTLALGFTPALRRVQNLVERHFYPERFRLREMAHDFLKTVISLTDSKSLWNYVESRLRETAQIERIFPIVKKKDGDDFILEGDETEPSPFHFDQKSGEKMIVHRRPIVVDEALAGARLGISSEEGKWLKKREVTILLPMVVQSRLVGFLGLGFKIGREDYSPDELLILSSLASQLALASENIRLLEENIEKRRMEEELSMARSIQRGFLPSDIPSTPNLQVAAGSLFCLEVAGDYYDIITLRNEETVLAVGDVSGKGAGAALLMANLQASLRTAIDTGIQLNDIVRRINNLIHSNTPPEQYITFFVGIFEPKTRTLTYVNAGHNFPVVIRENGSMVELDKGGLILGFLPDAEYEQRSVILQPGELLLMYTDGVSEAMNAEEEEYGEVRMLDCIRHNYDQPIEDILSGLENSVRQFIGDEPLQDDFTLILAKVDSE